MSFAFLRLSVVASALVVIAGCGGGGSSSTCGTCVANPQTVNVKFQGNTPTAVATKIGSGSFTSQTAAATLTLSIPVGDSNFAVAYACPALSETGGSLQLNQETEIIFEASTADGDSLTLPCPAPASGPTGQTGTLTGTVDATAIAGTSFVSVGAADGNQSAWNTLPGLDSSFSFAAPAGDDRVMVLAYQNSFINGFEEVTSLLAARNFSSQTVPGALNSGTTVTLGAADQVTMQPITYNNVPAGFPAPTTEVFFAMGSSGFFWSDAAATTQYPALPAGAVQSGDTYEYFATDYYGSQGVLVESSATSGGPVAFAFPAPWNYAGPTPAALPTFDFAYTGFTGSGPVADLAEIEWQTTSGNVTNMNSIEVGATANYLGSSTSVAVPDLSTLPGFMQTPASRTLLTCFGEIIQGNSALFPPTIQNLNATAVTEVSSYYVP